MDLTRLAVLARCSWFGQQRSLLVRVRPLSSGSTGSQGKNVTGNNAGSRKASTPPTNPNTDPPPFVFKEVNTQDVGPGAAKDKEYKNPEYFSYHKMSYADMDIAMEKLRCPQPSSLKK